MSEKDRDFLDDMTLTTTATETPETPEPEQVEEVETGDTPAPAKEQTQAPPAEVEDKASTVPIAALMAERDKRKGEQAQREALQRQLDELKTKEQAPFFEDPEGFVARALSEADQRANARLYAVLDANAREQYADYDEVLEGLKSRMEQNPALHAQVFQSPNPAKAAYQLGKQLREMDQMQDPVAYRQKLEAEIRAEIERERTEREQGRRTVADAIPPDLAAARSASSNNERPTGEVFEQLFPKE